MEAGAPRPEDRRPQEPSRVLGVRRVTPGTPPPPAGQHRQNCSRCQNKSKESFLEPESSLRLRREPPAPPLDLGPLPVVPQVHRTFFNFAKDFKAALQLRARAVGPQSAHVHDPSLLLLVRREDRHESGRLKVEVCCFSSAGLNETVPMAAVPSGAPSPSPPAVLSLIGSACFLLSDQVAGAAPSVCLGNTIPPSLLPTHQPERFLSNDVFKFGGGGASAKNKPDADAQTDRGDKRLSTFQRGRGALRVPGYSFPAQAASRGAGGRAVAGPQRTSGSSPYNSGTKLRRAAITAFE